MCDGSESSERSRQQVYTRLNGHGIACDSVPQKAMTVTKLKHNYHRLYRIFPAMDLADHTYFAFNGAAYHLNRVKELLNSAGMQTLWTEDTTLDERTRAERQGEVNLFHQHLRAFLWELVATFDTMLQWANQRYELGVPEKDVKWSKIQKKAKDAKKDQADWEKKYLLLESAWDSDWYFEVRGYRNFAHRAFLNVQAAIVKESDRDRLEIAHLFPIREGQREFVLLQEQLSIYSENMRQLGAAVF